MVTSITGIRGQSERQNVLKHSTRCSEVPLNVTVSVAQVVLSGKVLSLPRTSGSDASEVRVIHVYRGLSRVRGNVVKVRGLDRRGACGGRVPRGAVRIFLLDRTGVWGTFQLSSAPLRLNKVHLDRLRTAYKGKE